MILFSSCNASQTTSIANISPETENLLTALRQQSYRIEVETVKPFNTAVVQNVLNGLFIQRTGNTSNRIYVTGDGNFIACTEENVTGELPFFGEQRQGSGYYGNSSNGIVINGLPRDYQVFPHRKKEAVMITFTVSDSNNATEHYDFSIMVFTNKSVNISVVSTHRTTIEYTGILKWTQTASL